jgi:hypothetical protein
LSLARILHQVGQVAATEFSRAVVIVPLMNAAAVDTDFVGLDDTMDKLQRSLWCGGSTSATGLHRSTSNLVSHRIIGELQWSRRLELQRVRVWRRLLNHLKRGSWPREVANTCLQNAEADLARNAKIQDPYMAAIHDTLTRWDQVRGLLGTLPEGKSVSATVKIKLDERALKNTKVFDTGPCNHQRVTKEGRADDDFGENITRVVRAWKAQGFSGAALLAATTMQDMESMARGGKCAGTGRHRDDSCCSDESSDTMSDEDGWSDDDVLEERLTHIKAEELAMLRELAREAKCWEERLERKAHEEQERAWAREQVEYTPSDPRLGAGEAALWCRLHPPRNHRIGRERWGILHLIDFEHTPSVQTDRFIQMLAGTTPTLKTQRCKLRVTKEWRYTNDYSDAERIQATKCGCGKGTQDSTHILFCADPAVQALRDTITTRADTFFEIRREPLTMYSLYGRNVHTRGKGFTVDQQAKARCRHERGVRDWNRSSQAKKIEITMGSSDTELDNYMRTKIVTACISQWSDLEDIWDKMNEGT